MAAMERGDWEQALVAWDECLGRSPAPQPAEWLLGRVRALAGVGRVADAEECCRAGAACWPEDVRFIRQQAALASQLLERPRAIALLRGIIRRQPDDLLARAMRAHLLAVWGAPQQCRALLEETFVRARDRTVSDQLVARLLLAVQFCCRAGQRIDFLGKLADLAGAHADRERTGSAMILHARVRLALEDYAGARAIVADVRRRAGGHESAAGIEAVCSRRLDAGFPDYATPKIFCIGLSRTATSSLDGALKMLGYRSLHWNNPLTLALISEQDLLLYDAFSDIGVSWRFERLYSLFPNARFIYTTRPVASWARSVAVHYAKIHGVGNPRELSRPAFRDRYDGMAGCAEMNLYGGHDSWEACHRAFDARVRAFFADAPRERFLELAICEGEGWERLCGFLGLPVPDAPFPKKNATRATAS